MRLRVRLLRVGGDVEDVEVTADANARVGDVARALASRDPHGDGGRRSGTVTLGVRGAGAEGFVTLEAADRLSDLGIASGSDVRVEEPAGPSRKAVARLRVVAGPDAGRTFPLPVGTSMVGRDKSCELVLADAAVSKRHARLVVTETSVEIVDMNSANGVVVDGVPVRRHDVSGGVDVLLGRTVVTVEWLRADDRRRGRIPRVVDFVRSPRVEPRFPGVERETLEYPARPEPQPFPWLAVLSPLAMGAATFAVTQSPLTLLFVLMSPLLMMGMWMGAALQARRRRRSAREAFQETFDRIAREVEEESARECAARFGEAPSLGEVCEAIGEGGSLLWSRRPEHWSFLHVRLGVGPVPSRNGWKGPAHRDRAVAADAERVEALLARARTLPAAPVVECLPAAGGLGVAGEVRLAAGYLRGLLLQLAGLHSPAELVLAGILGPRWRGEFEDVKWLPHVEGARGLLGGSTFATTPASAVTLVSAMESLLEARAGVEDPAPARLGPLDAARSAEQEGADPGRTVGAPPPTPVVLLLVSEDAPVDRGRLIRLVERSATRGVVPVVVARSLQALPAACRTFVELRGERTAQAGFVRLGEFRGPMSVDSLPRDQMGRLCRALARFRDAGEPAEAVSDVPSTVSLVSILGAELSTDGDAVIDRWRQNGSVVSGGEGVGPPAVPRLRALVGSTAEGALALDLRAHGPHALVGGTTGSGKSEFLQAWVLALAAEYSPERVTFLLVDYKGGAAFGDCVRLPQCVGLVTDLNPHLVRRALASLRAEIRFRELLFQRKGAKDVIELERRRDPECPPALVIVIDEFAALVGEVPEFVDGVIDIAQRGRSLGIHLILATQRPAGVIREAVRANTNLRVALRMAEAADSEDVVGSGEAAGFDPSVPGRAIAKRGPGRATVFQAAYSGGRTVAAADPQVSVVSFGLGSPTMWPTSRASSTPRLAEDGSTDQLCLVETMRSAAESLGLGSPRRPWLEELACVYDLSALPQRSDVRLAVGVGDFPARQSQETVSFEPDASGHLAVVGTSGSGKSTLLRTLALAAGRTSRISQTRVYAVDSGSGGLRMLEPLPHVGSVIPGDDSERVLRLFRTLLAWLDERVQRFSAASAGDLEQYRLQSGVPVEERVIVLIDGFEAFRAHYETVPGRRAAFDALQRIVTEGRAVGIHLAVAANRLQGIPSAMQAQIQRRVVLRMADSDAYAAMGAPGDVLDASSPPGRALWDGVEMQVAVPGGTASLRGQAEAIAAQAVEMVSAGWGRAEPIGALPTSYGVDDLPDSVAGLPVVGVSDADLGPLGFSPVGVMILTGPPLSGRSNALAALAVAMRRWRADVRLFMIAEPRSPLLEAAGWAGTASTPEEAAALLSSVTGGSGEVAPAVFVEGFGDLVASSAERGLSRAVRAARSGELLLVAEGDVSTWGSSFGVGGEAKAARRGVILQPESHDGDVVVKTPFPRFARGEFPVGRGIAVERGRMHRVQFPLVDEEAWIVHMGGDRRGEGRQDP